LIATAATISDKHTERILTDMMYIFIHSITASCIRLLYKL